MLGESHLCEVLRAQEIDTSFIDYSLSYRENCDNLYKQFGIQFSQTNYSQKYRRADEMLNRDTMIANMRKPIEPVQPLPKPRFPFDPVERSRQVETVVCQGDKRRYYRFRYSEFYDGIVTGDMVGCNFLCAYCWNYARNENPCAPGGAFCAPSDVILKLRKIAKAEGCDQFRLSGAEPFLGLQSASHIAQVIKSLPGSWVIETNGYILALNPDLLSQFEDLDVFWRVTIKGHDASTFEKVTGALGKDYLLPLMAVDFLAKEGFRYQVAYNPKFVDGEALGLPAGSDIELEKMRSYQGVSERLKARGLSQPTNKPTRRVAKSWKPLRKEGDEWGEV